MDIRTADGRLLFSAAELACKATGVVRLAPGFADALRELRLAWDKPMRVNSCCRSYEHNRRVGGHDRSLHVYDQSGHGLGGTAAIDIAVASPPEALALAQLAIERGWSVGVAKSFLHLDLRTLAGLPQGLFGY